jgi:predicted metal-binding protein
MTKKKENGREIYLRLGNEQYFIEVEPVIDLKMRAICTQAYPNHPKGCPNFNKASKCPPQLPTIDKLINLDIRGPIYAIFNRYDFKAHCDKMRVKHPEWSQRQVECCLYWQGTARKNLREKIRAFIWKHPHYDIVSCPEGAGVNITETMKNAGIELEWPPVNYTYQVALAGIPKGEFQYG